ncbi:hypothetical protein C0J50_14658 [Silurus asotus]|uniref:Uncharacterized protein n=1 Tax=Silurus asotus TaxID=30991 RepID=A0AAD5AZB4_SILAS|nr:hypothetical protein C0J50_14658 [Silurus asotus]
MMEPQLLLLNAGSHLISVWTWDRGALQKSSQEKTETRVSALQQRRGRTETDSVLEGKSAVSGILRTRGAAEREKAGSKGRRSSPVLSPLASFHQPDLIKHDRRPWRDEPGERVGS